MKYIYLLIYVFLFSIELFGQQFPVFAQYPDHFSLINPAALNVEELGEKRIEGENKIGGHSLTIFHRNQWSRRQIPGAPQTAGLYWNWLNKDKWIFGGQTFFNQIGPIRASNIGLKVGRVLFDGLTIAGKFELLNYRVTNNIRETHVINNPTDTSIDIFQKNSNTSRIGVGFFYENYTQRDPGILAGISYARPTSNQTTEGNNFSSGEELSLLFGIKRKQFLFTSRYTYYNDDSQYLEFYLKYMLLPKASLYIGSFATLDQANGIESIIGLQIGVGKIQNIFNGIDGEIALAVSYPLPEEGISRSSHRILDLKFGISW